MRYYKRKFRAPQPKVATRKTINGREICLANDAGRAEYTRRKQLLWEWQGGLCKVCEKRMWMLDARMTGGAWKETEQERNDRLRDKAGNQVNFLAHKACLATWHRQNGKGDISPLAALAMILLLTFFPVVARAQASNAATVSGQAITPYGGPAAGAIVRICPVTATIVSGVCTPTSTIYSDSNLEHVISNPTTADANGNWSIFTPSTPLGLYTVQVTVQPGTTYTYYWGEQSPGGAAGSPPQYSIQYYSTSTNLGSDPDITINPTAHSINVAGSGTGSIQLGGSASGGLVTQTVAPSTGTWTDTLPPAAPTANGNCREGLTSGTEYWGPCAGQINPGWIASLAANQGASDTTITLSISTTGLASSGCFYLDSEWECYTGTVGNTLTGLTRGYHTTTAAAHTAGASVVSVNVDFINPSASPSTGVFGYGFFSVGNGTPSAENQTLTAQIGAHDYFSTDGSLYKNNTASVSIDQGEDYIVSGLKVGGGGLLASSAQVLITQSNQVLQTSGPNSALHPISFNAGIAGPVESVQASTIGAPTLQQSAPVGTSSRTYECTGVDQDGGTIPGTTATLATLPASWATGEVLVICPLAAGVTTYSVWRTAGGASQGLLGTGKSVADTDQAVSGTAPVTNTTVPKTCVNGEQFCTLSGTSGTPSVSCASGTQGWVYHNVSATTTPFAQVCNGTSWVTAF